MFRSKIRGTVLASTAGPGLSLKEAVITVEDERGLRHDIIASGKYSRGDQVQISIRRVRGRSRS